MKTDLTPDTPDAYRTVTEALHRTPLDLRLVMALAGGRAPNAREEQMMDKLKAERGDSLYSDMLYALTRHTFPTRQAITLWADIVKHREALKNTLGRDVGITVAAHDYVCNVSGLLRNMGLIEEGKFIQLTQVASHDGLTGLYDKMTFERILTEQLAIQARHKRPCTLVMADIDYFKKLNDTHGHADGDIVLAQVAKILAQHCRATDTPGRIGGEEFAVILPENDANGGMVFAERVRAAVQTYFTDTPYKVTISVGVAGITPAADTLNQSKDILIRNADTALYVSKHSGRNRVSLAQT
jgi:diguanylate cyclase (GGDEF)-like protein